ncbi:hypothetical protein BN14_07758 [Rhizoctonia solani AG-1 IB]|uniref:MACPF domain-containing protein n=1 Tax=Thanatephorus cucumeris (strain AG1-IB / isolate 7/3/14) TaxID=1108050 RepID=M5C118_THACB|nr:hypothetical protein BN14_07758 [Rhizoctonia solani AG-1 IB]
MPAVDTSTLPPVPNVTAPAVVLQLKAFKLDKATTDKATTDKSTTDKSTTDKSTIDPPSKTYQTTPLASFEHGCASTDAFKTSILNIIRPKIKAVMTEVFRFSDAEGSIISDDTTIESYLRSLGTPFDPTKISDPIKVYVIPFKEPPVSIMEILNSPPFILKFAQRVEGGEVKREGTLASDSFPAMKGGKIPLGEIRPRIAAMSSAFTRHQFCLQDGHLVDDHMLLSDYLISSSKPADQTELIPSLEVYFCKPGVNTAGVADWAKTIDALKTDSTLKGDALNVERDKSLLEIKEQLDASKYRVSEFAVKDAKSAGKLTEDEWGLVIRNCNLMFGWVVDVDNNTIKRAPKAGETVSSRYSTNLTHLWVAFRLKKGLNMPVGYVPPVYNPTTTPVTTTNTTTTSVATSVPLTAPATINPATGQPMPATSVPPTTTTGVPNTTGIPVTTTTAVPTTTTGLPVTTTAVPTTTTSTSQSTTTTTTTNVRLPEKANAIPNFAVTDDSRIEITMVEHQFQESMAKSHFSSTSVEASVSGGIGAFSVGVSTSVSKSSSHEEKKSRKESEKTLVGSYLFPRATVNLTPSDLEPTEDLKSAIAKIRTKKDITDLRKLHRDFGMPHVFASVKTSHEQGSASQQGTTTADSKEKLVFEATGGNTLLATNPDSWSASLSDYSHWRAIKRDELTSLSDAISQIEGYSSVMMWFSQAVPALSKYVQIPPSRSLTFRLKAIADTPRMKRVFGTGDHRYLGHNPTQIPELVQVGVDALSESLGSEFVPGAVDKGWPIVDLTAFTQPRYLSKPSGLFTPRRTQAPVLVPYTGKITAQKPTDDKAKADLKAFDNIYKQTVWKFEVPDGDVLVHESRVSITSFGSDVNPTLSVFRTEQGAFLPAMTSQDGPSYWRVLRSDPTARPGDPIRDGDNIRLCWVFSDQTAGFRDFYDDTFGRRRFSKPDECSDALYLKVPYPPFSESTNTVMVLSGVEITKPVVEPLRVVAPQGVSYNEGLVCYNLHDVSFRLDFVGSEVVGETRDYMAPVSGAESGIPSMGWDLSTRELRLPALMVANLLLPGAKGPTAAVLLSALLL